jgi:hypothetical protein
MQINCDGTWNIISKVPVQQAGHCIMARNYGKISVWNLTYWIYNFSWRCMKNYETWQFVIYTHNTPNVTHTVGEVWAKILCRNLTPMHSLFSVCKNQQGITNTLALPIDKMLYIYLPIISTLWTTTTKNPFQFKLSKHFH